MTLCYRLFGQPGNLFEFFDAVKRSEATEIFIYADVRTRGNRRTSEILFGTDDELYRLRQPMNRSAGTFTFNKHTVEEETFRKALSIAHRLRGRGYAVLVNDRPIGHAQEVWDMRFDQTTLPDLLRIVTGASEERAEAVLQRLKKQYRY